MHTPLLIGSNIRVVTIEMVIKTNRVIQSGQLIKGKNARMHASKCPIMTRVSHAGASSLRIELKSNWQEAQYA